MPSGTAGRPRWHKPALVLALLLVVGQVVVFFVLRSSRKHEERDTVSVQEHVVANDHDVLVLVLGPETPSVTSDQIRNVFLGRTTVWPNGTTARPLHRPADSLAAKTFYAGVLEMNPGAYAEHWSQLGSGDLAPPAVSSSEEVVAKVAATAGGLGYVMESELPVNAEGVRLVRLRSPR